MKDALINRREFLRNLGVIGAGTLLSISPWLSVFSEVVETSSEKCHLAIIGTGSKGHFLMSFSLQNPYLQPIITQYFIDNKSEIWLLFLIAHSKR